MDNIKKAEELALLKGGVEKDVEKILSFVEEVQSVNTDGVNNLAMKKNLFREDKVENSNYKEDILKLAPNRLKGWIVTKKIL